MNPQKRMLAILIACLAALMTAAPVFADWAGSDTSTKGITPVYYADWESKGGALQECQNLGYSSGYKVDASAPNGTYHIDGGFNTITISNSNNYTFDWSATLGLDAVIVKAATGANVYTYSPEVMSDGNLHSPYTGSGPSDPGTIRQVSHVTFCFDYEVTVTKTANTAFTRTHQWTISKSADTPTLDLFKGDSGTVNYTVAVDKTGFTDSAWGVNGTIKIKNNSPLAATVENVTDELSGIGPVAVTCNVTFPYALNSGQELSCTYSTSLPDGANRINTATATTSGAVGGGSGTADVTFGDPTTVVNGEINVTDSNGMSWGPVAEDTSWDYKRTFACNDNAGDHPNTATITETGAKADASVTVRCYELTVTKGATTAFKRTYNWTIAKSVTPATWDLFLGDEATSKYTIAVEKTGHTDSEWAVEGKITVYNPAPMAAPLNGVADVVSTAINGTVDCGVTFPYALSAGTTLECTYTAALPDGADRTNTATATLQNTPSGTTDFSGTADVTFGAPTTEVNTKINVDDTNGESWEFDGSGSVSYNSDPFTCKKLGTYTHDNTATIRETGLSDKATVTVNCYDPVVTKGASTSLTRTYNWTIDKSADQSSLKLSVNQSFLVNYTVKVDATYTDSDWAVSGKIEVYNSSPMAAMINSVTDELDSVGAIAVDCDVSFPYELPGGETLVCTYSSSLPDTTSRTNTATAKQQTYSYDPDGNATPSGDYDYTGSVNVNFTAPTINQVDECIDVDDSFAGSLVTVCYGVDTLPKEIKYSWSVGSYTACGDYTATNTATFTTNDTSATGSDSWPIAIKVPCEGCTLTIGYWKTHAGFGPQADKVTPLLPRWLGTTSGAKSIQVTTASQAVALLDFKGSNNVKDASNGINKLYAQLLAAKLNIANGAGGSAVAATITAADAFLANKNSLSWAGLSRSQKNQVNTWAGTLDQYNNGLIGPGHCSEDGAAGGLGVEDLLKRLFLPTVLNQ